MTDSMLPAGPPAYPAPASRRPVWPWVLGGAGLLFLLLIAAAVIAVIVFINSGSAAKKVVLDFDRAYETQDCELFESVTTPGFVEDSFGYPFDCEGWRDYASTLTVNGAYQYSVVILTARENGGTAEVTTIETDNSAAEPVVYNITYYLVRTGGQWLIDGSYEAT